jgi:hypothetical protein
MCAALVNESEQENMTEKNRNADVDLLLAPLWLMYAVAAAAISGAGVAWWVHSPGEVKKN